MVWQVGWLRGIKNEKIADFFLSLVEPSTVFLDNCRSRILVACLERRLKCNVVIEKNYGNKKLSIFIVFVCFSSSERVTIVILQTRTTKSLKSESWPTEGGGRAASP
jgi:hypothetical protein